MRVGGRIKSARADRRSDVAASLIAIRTKHNLTQEALAKMLGTYQHTLSRWERGEDPSNPRILLLALESVDRHLAVTETSLTSTSSHE